MNRRNLGMHITYEQLQRIGLFLFVNVQNKFSMKKIKNKTINPKKKSALRNLPGQLLPNNLVLICVFV